MVHVFDLLSFFLFQSQYLVLSGFETILRFYWYRTCFDDQPFSLGTVFISTSEFRTRNPSTVLLVDHLFSLSILLVYRHFMRSNNCPSISIIIIPFTPTFASIRPSNRPTGWLTFQPSHDCLSSEVTYTPPASAYLRAIKRPPRQSPPPHQIKSHHIVHVILHTIPQTSPDCAVNSAFCVPYSPKNMRFSRITIIFISIYVV